MSRETAVGVGMRAVDTGAAAACREPELAGGCLGFWRGCGGPGLEEAAGSAVCGHGVVSDTASATCARPTWCMWDNGGAGPTPRRYANAVAAAGVIL